MQREQKIKTYFRLVVKLLLVVWMYSMNQVVITWYLISAILDECFLLKFGIHPEAMAILEHVTKHESKMNAILHTYIIPIRPDTQVGKELSLATNLFTTSAMVISLLDSHFFDGLWFAGSVLTLVVILALILLTNKNETIPDQTKP